MQESCKAASKSKVLKPVRYLQHFELMTILPALVIGYINVARFLPNAIRTFLHEGHHSIATWAWVLPTCVLLYSILEYHPPSSVLYVGNSRPALQYCLLFLTLHR